MLLEAVLLIAGLLMLWKGSDITVQGAKCLAEKFGISHTIIGLTIVSIGTSLPEIFTIVYSGLEVRAGYDTSGLAIGTAIGSDIAQITLLLGITALVGTMYATKEGLRREGAMLLLAIVALWIACADGRLEPFEGALLVMAYMVYLMVVERRAGLVKGIKDEIRAQQKAHIKAWRQIALMGVGLGVLIIGSKLVVDNAMFIAETTGVAQGIIGIFLVGVGTSLPELSVAVAGMRSDAVGISLGTLVGSNITDPLLSLGLGGAVAGFAVDRTVLVFDLPFWLISTVIVLILMRRNYRIGLEDRMEGAILIGIYATYVSLRLIFF